MPKLKKKIKEQRQKERMQRKEANQKFRQDTKYYEQLASTDEKDWTDSDREFIKQYEAAAAASNKEGVSREGKRLGIGVAAALPILALLGREKGSRPVKPN